MVRIYENVTDKRPGMTMPHSYKPNHVSGQSWLLWRASLTYAMQKGGTPADHAGRPGYIIRSSLRSIARDLWPEYERDRRVLSDMTQHRVYPFLRHTVNAICLDPGPKTTTWWIASEFETSKTSYAMSKIAEADPRTKVRFSDAERKLTPHEAGEDREPEPVTESHWSEPEESDDVPPPPVTEQQRLSAADRRELILEALGERSPEPLSFNEISELSGMKAGGEKPADINNTLYYMVVNGTVFARHETDEERKKRPGHRARIKLYALESPVPSKIGHATPPQPPLLSISDKYPEVYRLLSGSPDKSFTRKDMQRHVDLHVTTIGVVLRELLEAGRIFRRVTELDERPPRSAGRLYAWSVTDPPPKMRRKRGKLAAAASAAKKSTPAPKPEPKQPDVETDVDYENDVPELPASIFTPRPTGASNGFVPDGEKEALRAEIARLTAENARLKAATQALLGQ